MTFGVEVGGELREFSEGKLIELAARYGIDRVAPERYSCLFVLLLHLEFECHGIDPAMIMEELKALETGNTRIGTKPATQYMREPLKGLWHKHFFSAHFLAKNLRNELGGGRLEAIVADGLGPMGTVVTEDKIKALSERLTVNTLQEREAERKLTGEWIVFAKHEDRNYYLTLATHDSGDHLIHQQIIVLCLPQFPFLEAQCRG